MLIFILCFAILQTFYGFIAFGHLYRPWTDTANPNRTNLFCHSDCDQNFLGDKVEKCCRCRMKPAWELELTDVEFLGVEYTSRRGTAHIVSTKQSMTSTYQVLVHTYGFLSKIPGNICDFAKKNGKTRPFTKRNFHF